MKLAPYVFFLALAICTPGYTAPVTCASGTLRNYFNLGSDGCTIGQATFSTFFDAGLSTGATQIDPATILVNPIASPGSPGFEFRVDTMAGPGDLLEARIGYTLVFQSRIPLVAHLSMARSSAEFPDGAATVVEELCPGGELVSVGSCQDPITLTPIPTQTQIVFTIGIDASLTERTGLPPLTRLGIITDIVVDGGPSGSAAIGSAINQFTVVPEPGTFWSLSAVLVCVWLRSRGNRQ